MTHPIAISTEEPAFRKRMRVLDSSMAYVDVGEGDPIIFLHGNPTPSYLWRHIIPALLPFGRCLAPDYVGMGHSGPSGNGSYRFFDHRKYVDAWIEAMELDNERVVLVLHDWGSALGFDWARRHPERVSAIAYMEGIVRPFRSWADWPEVTRAFFQGQRSDRGEDLILRQNMFIEYLLPLRGVPDEAIEVYRSHYRQPGPMRMPMLAWTRDLPISGEPADVVKVVDDYATWMASNPIPKLFIDAEPGGFLIGSQREFCRTWPNQETVVLKGAHFIQEEVPDEVAKTLAGFVAKIRVGAAS